jgi:hypothetical protein
MCISCNDDKEGAASPVVQSSTEPNQELKNRNRSMPGYSIHI